MTQELTQEAQETAPTPEPTQAATAREFYESMEQFAAMAGELGIIAFAMCRETFSRLVRESGVGEWHKDGMNPTEPPQKNVFILGPVDAPLLNGVRVVINETVPPGKVMRVTRQMAEAPPPPTPSDMPPIVFDESAAQRIQAYARRDRRVINAGAIMKAGRGRRVRYANQL